MALVAVGACTGGLSAWAKPELGRILRDWCSNWWPLQPGSHHGTMKRVGHEVAWTAVALCEGGNRAGTWWRWLRGGGCVSRRDRVVREIRRRHGISLSRRVDCLLASVNELRKGKDAAAERLCSTFAKGMP